MSGWHRRNPELVGTSADPWMANEHYAREMTRVLVDESVEDFRSLRDERADDMPEPHNAKAMMPYVFGQAGTNGGGE